MYYRIEKKNFFKMFRKRPIDCIAKNCFCLSQKTKKQLFEKIKTYKFMIRIEGY